VNAGLDVDAGTLLVGEEDFRTTFWVPARRLTAHRS